MAGTSQGDIGYYTLPVILSFDGIEKKVSSQLSKAFGDVGKKSSKAMADATEQDVARAAKAYGALRDKAQDALGKVRVEEEKLAKARASGKQDQIVAAEERLNKARRDSSRLTREAGAAYADLEGKQRRLGDGTSRLGGHFDGLGSMAGKAGAALTAAGVVAAGAALAGIANLGAGVVVAGRALYDLGQSWDDVTDAIAVKTGKLGPDLEKLKTAVKDLAPSTASSIDQIGSVVGSVSQALRVSGMDLDKVSKTILDLNRLTGEDLNIRELGKAFRGFNVDAKDQVSTLDAFYRASAATGISVNDMVAAVVQAGPAARTMGLNLSQTAALLGTFNEAGINGEAALKGLSLAAKNLAKDGRDPAVGLRETITEMQGLLKAGRDVDAVNLAAKIFGKGYQPLLDAIRSGALDAQSLNDALATGGVTIDQVARATDDWSERWQQLKNAISVTLEPLASGVFNIINAKLEGLADWITQNQDKVIGFFGQLVDWSFKAAKAIVGFVADSLRALAGLIEKIGPAIGDIGEAISWIPGLGGAGDALMDLEKSMQSWPQSIRGAADAVQNKLNPALQTGQDYADAYIKRTQQATKFTQVLGKTIATVNDNGEIVLSDNSPEVAERLKKLGITIVELPDGTFGVKADTKEAEDILKDYRDQEQGNPIKLPVDANTEKASTAIEDLKKAITANPVEIPVNAGPFNPGGILGPNVPGRGPQKFAPSGLNIARPIAGENPQISAIGALASQPQFGLTLTSGRRNEPGSDHNTGQAGDFSNGTDLTPEMRAFAEYMSSNFGSYISQLIYGDPTFKGNIGGPYSQDLLNQHRNHVHIAIKDEMGPAFMQAVMGSSGGGMSRWSASSPGNDIQGWLYGQLVGNGLSADQARGILAMNAVEGGASDPKSLLGFTESQAKGPAAHVAAFMKQWNDMSRRPGGRIPGVAADGTVTDWNAYMTWIREKIVGQTGVRSDWQGNAQPNPADYQARLMQALSSGGSFKAWGPDAWAPGQMPRGFGDSSAASTLDLSGAIDTSRLYTDPTGAMSTATGTPGYKDGQAGYFQPDPKRVREATQKVDDMNESIRQADAAVAQAQANLDELDYTASESQRLSATESLRSAKYRRDKAIRDRDDAIADLAETQRGDFTKAKAAGKGKGGSSDSQLGGLGSIASAFLKDTFGLDLSNFMPLQMLNSLMGFASPIINDAMSGNLGIQTPGWYPGMPAEDFAALQQSQGTSPGPFGIPNIDAPPMPEGNRHTGAGAAPGPGPGTIVNVDNSQNFTNSPLGWDPAQVNKQRDNNIMRAPRLPIGMGG